MTTDAPHLAPEQIAGYRQRTLAPGELVHVADHLAHCAPCRGQADSAERLSVTVAALRTDLASACEAIEHPTLDQIAAFVDATLEPDEAELLESHLALCPVCAEDVADLRGVRGAMARSSPEPAIANTPRWAGYAALTALAAGLAGLLVWAGSRPGPVSDRPAISTPGSVLEPPEPQFSAAGAEVTIRDGRARVTLQADGRVQGLAALAHDEAAGIRAALVEGRVDLPPLISDLGGSSGTLMSGASDRSAFGPYRPVATAVEPDRPVFEWTRLEGAATYVVSIVDRDFNLVAESPPLVATSWRLDRPLARGRTYAWQVRASRAGDSVVAPSPPAPEARFHVVDEAVAARLADVRRRHGDSHLVQGIALARVGALDEAEREIERLVAANPGVAQVERLQRAIRDQRKTVSVRP